MLRMFCFNNNAPDNVQTPTYGYRSVTGYQHQREGTQNQDSHFASRASTGELIAGVFDGHGKHGHELSKQAATLMREAIIKRLDDATSSIRTILTAAFAETAKNISAMKEAQQSGTTATVVVIRACECTIAYAGDSSALLVSKDWRGAFVPKFATRPHRPGVSKSEDARIRAYGGIIYENYVVDKTSRKKAIAVTRTIGDNDMVDSGCIPDPSFESLNLTRRDCVIVVASDGLWDAVGVNVNKVTTTVEKVFANRAARAFRSNNNNNNIDPNDISQSESGSDVPLTDAEVVCDALITLAKVPADDCSILVINLQENNSSPVTD